MLQGGHMLPFDLQEGGASHDFEEGGARLWDLAL
jgi:hypothetical protein